MLERFFWKHPPRVSTKLRLSLKVIAGRRIKIMVAVEWGNPPIRATEEIETSLAARAKCFGCC